MQPIGGSGDDPGWRPAVRDLVWMLSPALALRRQRTQVESGKVDGLASLRSLFVTFVLAGVGIGTVVAILAATNDTPDDGAIAPAVLAVVALGVVSLVAGQFIVRRPLDCTSDGRLVATYTTRFFQHIAVAESVALASFVAFIATDEPLLFPLGVLFSAVGFASAAPTGRHLARDQERLQLSGCGRSVVGALRARSHAAKR